MSENDAVLKNKIIPLLKQLADASILLCHMLLGRLMALFHAVNNPFYRFI